MSTPSTPNATAYLREYDAQLRTDAETPSALAVARCGPLRLVTFAGERGFVTYQSLGGANAEGIEGLVDAALEHFRVATSCREVEWKTRGHDHAPGLHEALVRRGFLAEQPESIMIGPLSALVDAPVPSDVTVRRIDSWADVQATSHMLDRAFGEEPSPQRADDIYARLRREADRDDGMQLWVAEVDGQPVSGGRLEPVPGTAFAGLWGGATLPEFRGRGIYRALTAARARAALGMGRTLAHSDCSEHSRPILERSGLVKVSTTTPYVWTRPSGEGPDGRH